MKVWIFMDTDTETGPGSIKGIYKTEEEGKLAIADYVLKTQDITSTYIDLFETEILEGGRTYESNWKITRIGIWI